MATFERSVHLPCPPSVAFNLHLDPNNLIALSPPNMHTTIISCRLPLHEGSVIALDVKRWGLSQLWEVEILTLKPDTLLVDRALQSPFGAWRHEHRFEPEGAGTRMTDSIEFKPPFGVVGYLAMPLIRRELNQLFIWRHQKTLALIKKH